MGALLPPFILRKDKNMKNIFKYIMCFAVCMVVLFTATTTANAEELDRVYCDSVFEVGDTAVFQCAYDHNLGSNVWHYNYSSTFTVTDSNRYACLYVDHSLLNFPNGILRFSCGSVDVATLLRPNQSFTYRVNDGQPSTENLSVTNVCPPPYFDASKYAGSGFIYTNIPIFDNEADAISYASGNVDMLSSAVNYKKVSENGSWVQPFEDIEINDMDMSSPQLSNVSHNGFTVVDIPNEKYMVDVYVESGLQQPYNYQRKLKDTGDALFVNNFGLVSDVEGAFTGEIDLLRCYGVDNETALLQSCVDFYTTYPSVKSFNDVHYPNGLGALENNSATFAIWGQPFSRVFVFWTVGSSVKSEELSTLDLSNVPIAFTNYKVRYFYYDDDSGFHYGPWTNFVYFSDGRVLQGNIYQGNDGSVIETPMDSGVQDSAGNVSVNTSIGNFVDLNNPNELFGYIRSVINNVNATGNQFMVLFANVFSFIPSEMQLALWFGIGVIILIGIIKALAN